MPSGNRWSRSVALSRVDRVIPTRGRKLRKATIIWTRFLSDIGIVPLHFPACPRILGTEMLISQFGYLSRRYLACRPTRYASALQSFSPSRAPVSYTHLTLPTNREV